MKEKKFTIDRKIDLAKEYIHNDLDQQEMARMYGVSNTTMCVGIREGVNAIYARLCKVFGLRYGGLPRDNEDNAAFDKMLEALGLDRKVYTTVKNYMEDGCRLKRRPVAPSTSPELIRSILEDYLAGDVTQSQLAKKYGLPVTKTGAIIRSETDRLYHRFVMAIGAGHDDTNIPAYDANDKRIVDAVDRCGLDPIRYATLRSIMMTRLRRARY